MPVLKVITLSGLNKHKHQTQNHQNYILNLNKFLQNIDINQHLIQLKKVFIILQKETFETKSFSDFALLKKCPWHWLLFLMTSHDIDYYMWRHATVTSIEINLTLESLKYFWCWWQKIILMSKQFLRITFCNYEIIKEGCSHVFKYLLLSTEL